MDGGGQPSSGFRASVVTGMNAGNTALSAFSLVVYSRKLRQYQDVTAYGTGNRWDTQRRRDGVGETITWNAI
jgi:hypothetical protein